MNKIRYLINNYGIFIIVFAICVIMYKFVDSYITEIMQSNNIDTLFQSTITCTSILLGFSGTLMTHIFNAKREFNNNSDSKSQKENKLGWFLRNVNPNTMVKTILICILSSVALIMMSLFMLVTDELTKNIQTLCFYIWLFIFIVFIYYEVGLYRLFISLLFDNTERQSPMSQCENPSSIQDCMNAIDNQNHS